MRINRRLVVAMLGLAAQRAKKIWIVMLRSQIGLGLLDKRLIGGEPALAVAKFTSRSGLSARARQSPVIARLSSAADRPNALQRPRFARAVFNSPIASELLMGRRPARSNRGASKMRRALQEFRSSITAVAVTLEFRLIERACVLPPFGCVHTPVFFFGNAARSRPLRVRRIAMRL